MIIDVGFINETHCNKPVLICSDQPIMKSSGDIIPSSVAFMAFTDGLGSFELDDGSVIYGNIYDCSKFNSEIIR